MCVWSEHKPSNFISNQLITQWMLVIALRWHIVTHTHAQCTLAVHCTLLLCVSVCWRVTLVCCTSLPWQKQLTFELQIDGDGCSHVSALMKPHSSQCDVIVNPIHAPSLCSLSYCNPDVSPKSLCGHFEVIPLMLLCSISHRLHFSISLIHVSLSLFLLPCRRCPWYVQSLHQNRQGGSSSPLILKVMNKCFMDIFTHYHYVALSAVTPTTLVFINHSH